ncbi:porin [Cupriavidus oxalaticus]|uniref:Membrane protein n=1 Tax=Cupriavidus oxalaticus TaxID=96344 RepID=A0A375GLS9_9BURK|nr:porin [Cupriavidus oxalaticus]QRQ85503.1 porin [Cupriavidus oxalaticus]QRQ90409.1 porin [Cupriavidus oxalaticus]WQD84924.1 porin [Cupriavidus oxalaticus]SPC09870.1 Membrane protein [Cupriavidus oxalaticus]SPC24318.1 Membrane protein [Cupriavidus oxalaticus]
MKIRTLAAAAALACSGGALAQATVTLYGVVDTNVEYVNHVGAVPVASNQFNRGPANDVYRMNSGGISGSRWGMRGTEDLGGGLKGLFVLESGFNLDTGTMQQSNRLFGRQAFVGLQKDGIGQISLGRQYTSMFEALANFSPTAYATQYEPVVLQSGPNFRADNTIKYSGKFGPVTALAHWSFGTGLALPATVGIATPVGGNGEVPGQFRRDTAWGAAAAYQGGPFGVTFGYDQWNPTIGTSNGTVKKAVVGASYSYGPAKIMGGYRWGQNKNAADVVIQRDDFYWVGATYQVTPTIGLTLEYNYDDVKSLYGDTNVANPWQVAFVANYAFSKRTDLYLTTAYAKNAGLMLESLATVYANSLSLGNSYVLANGQSNMFGAAVGIRHKF